MLLAALKLRNKLFTLPCSHSLHLCQSLSLSPPFSLLSFAISLCLPGPPWPQLLGNLSYAYLAAVAIPISSCNCPQSRLPLSCCLVCPSAFQFYASLWLHSAAAAAAAAPQLLARLSLPFLSFCFSFAQLFVRAARHFLPHCK